VRPALDRISLSTLGERAVLRIAILENLQLASENFVEYSVKAIREWIGPDLVQLNQFQRLFQLVSHPDMRVQNSALSSLKTCLQNREYQESLERAGIVPFIQSLSELDNPEAISFVAMAISCLGLTLARHGHVGELLSYLEHEDSSVQTGACTAIETIANGSADGRRQLLKDGVLEKLIGSSECLGPSELRLAASIIPKLAFEYVHAKRITVILTLAE
jgi:hypothetical protein